MRKLGEAQRTQHDRLAFKLLGFDGEPDDVTVQELDARWRVLRSELHPDKPGGSAEVFDTTKKAYDAARYYALEPKPCTECKGSGKIEVMSGSGFKANMVKLNCHTCKGSGQR